MRRKIHVTEGTPDGPAEAIVDDNPTQDMTGANALPIDDTTLAPAASNDGDPPHVITITVTALQAEIESLRAEVERLMQELEDERNQHLRTLADFQNFRRRKEEERGGDRQFANRELILGMLPVLDNFERALAAAERNQSYEALIDGIKLTLRQFCDFLGKNGVSAIDAVGKEFDPKFHEAVMRVEDSAHPENTVVEELQKGYAIHDRVLRPSMVKVARSE